MMLHYLKPRLLTILTAFLGSPILGKDADDYAGCIRSVSVSLTD